MSELLIKSEKSGRKNGWDVLEVIKLAKGGGGNSAIFALLFEGN